MPPRAEPRVPALAVLVALVALGAAQAAELTGTDRADRLVGTTSPDTIRGRAGNDRIEGRRGGDHPARRRRTRHHPRAGRPRPHRGPGGRREGHGRLRPRSRRRQRRAPRPGRRRLRGRDPAALAGSVHRRRSARDAGGAGQRLLRLDDRRRVPVGAHLLGRRRGNRVGDLGRRREDVAAGIPGAGRRSRQRPGRGLRPTAPNLADSDARA